MWQKHPFLVTFLIALLVAFGLTAALFLYILLAQPTARPLSPDSLAAVTVMPAWTPTTVLLLPTFTPPPMPTRTLTPLPGRLAVGMYVEISGTGIGLRIRSAPGLDAPPLFIGADSEVFQITDGPRQADGYTWWYLVALYDTTRAGWAVQDYLQPIPSP